MISKRDDRLASLQAASKIIEAVHQHYPRMELGQLRVLLRVLEKPGIRASELVTLTGLSKSALSRAIRTLGSGPYTHDGDGSKKQGLNLISQVSDPFDSRAKLVAPTAVGRRLGEEIQKIIGDTRDGT